MLKLKRILRLGRGTNKYPLLICIAIMAVYATCTFIFLCGVIYKFFFPYSSYVLDFPILDMLMARISNPWSVALYVVCIKAFVDGNKDGTPDEFEDKGQIVKSKNNGGEI